MNMNRRTVLRGALGSSIAIAGTGWSCLPAMAQEATKNTLTWITDFSYQHMSPASTDSAEISALGNVYETLFVYKDGKVLPKLASSWDRSDGGKTWTIRLREGVKFHDGSLLNSVAVKKSFEFQRDLGKGGSYLYAGLENVETPDEDTAIFRFKNAIAFDLVAAGQYGGFVIGQAGVDKGDDWLRQGNAVGTGPYVLKDFQQGKQIVLDRFDEYWGGWESGQIDRVIHPYVADEATRIQMVHSGEADITPVPASQIKSVDALPNVSVMNALAWRTDLFFLNVQKYPTDNLKFRQALVHLWDYDTVLKDIYYDTAKKPVGTIPLTVWGHGTYDVGTFDPEKALALLEESGIPRKDWKIKAMFSAQKERNDAIELFRANAAAVGLEVELELYQVYNTYASKARSLETSGHMNSSTWWPSYPTPADTLVYLFHSQKALFNVSYYRDEEYDRLVDEGLKLEGVDRDAAAKTYIAAQDRLMQNAVAIFYAEPNRVFAYSSDLNGVEENNNPAYEWLSIYSLRK
ncbi:ABC transporter substrate-binding protein [Rhizobium azibense]|uniref:Peptide/nickel transport system substrate-binding protein n=1 Tax=Rhizobium azibense TaxID=1136135 RepID=A0A4R3R9L4_9HYPH|nr:ABC transporter substrate-binding protein [Rhizobium azibense]TCU31451.1 peptide/nickel transport system substrate-binding protein [Rhizobium azibense]